MSEDVERAKTRAVQLHARVTAAYAEVTDATLCLSRAVRALHRDHAMSYAQIGAILGVSKTRAYQLAQQQGRQTPTGE